MPAATCRRFRRTLRMGVRRRSRAFDKAANGGRAQDEEFRVYYDEETKHKIRRRGAQIIMAHIAAKQA
eukprot:scaffold82379_cov67-Phaeocystis_antarctica.AAC.8